MALEKGNRGDGMNGGEWRKVSQIGEITDKMDGNIEGWRGERGRRKEVVGRKSNRKGGS